jgi:hypothetical protein
MDIGTLLAKHALDEKTDLEEVVFDANNNLTDEEKIERLKSNIEYGQKLIHANEDRYNRLKMLSGRRSFNKLSPQKRLRYSRRLTAAATAIIDVSDACKQYTQLLQDLLTKE